MGKSPFEARSEETGGSLSICVLGGDWRFPDEGARAKGKDKGADKGKENGNGQREEVISDAVKDVVRRCLRVEPAERPDVDELIEILETVIAGLPPDEDGLED